MSSEHVSTGVVAHLIVGATPEPALAALLQSIEPFADLLIVNENSGLPETENLMVLQASGFAQTGRIVTDRTAFVDFAQARNRCLEIHRERNAGPWVAFVDADEVHDRQAIDIARRLHMLPASIGIVDGYTRHFFQSPDWYFSVERRMSFFRFVPEARWHGAVHERLSGVPGARICLPYVYAHYGHLATTERHVRKEQLYHALGQGEHIAEEAIATLRQDAYFKTHWPLLLRFKKRHPPAAAAFIAGLRITQAEYFAQSERHIATFGRPPKARMTRAWWRFNYALRWKSRWLNPLARRLMARL